MRGKRATQSLSYPIRLPDAVQADALRLLDVSREVINATVVALWPHLDEFGARESRYAYKQVSAMIGSSDPHGDRQWRCEAEQAGRILRGQAERKKQFALILPLLEVGMIEPKTEQKRAGKNRKAIKQALVDLREENSDGGSAVELQSLIEQSCNFYLKHGCFPDVYEEMQSIPVLKVGILPYAGDDGGALGQAYRLRLDLEGRCCYFAFRSPDEAGEWRPTWREPQMLLPLPDPVVERLQAGAALAPTLREIELPDGTRYAVLDFVIEVPVTGPIEWKQVGRVLGWDWGVRTLVTATVPDLDGNRLAPPCSWIAAASMGGRLTPGGILIASSRKWSSWKLAVTAFPLVISGGNHRRGTWPYYAGRSHAVGESMRRETTIWPTWPPIS